MEEARRKSEEEEGRQAARTQVTSIPHQGGVAGGVVRERSAGYLGRTGGNLSAIVVVILNCLRWPWVIINICQHAEANGHIQKQEKTAREGEEGTDGD